MAVDVKIWWDVKLGSYKVRAPYQSDFVDLMRSLPAAERTWDKANRAWAFEEHWLIAVERFIDSAFNVNGAKIDLTTRAEAEAADRKERQASGALPNCFSISKYEAFAIQFVRNLDESALQKAWRDRCTRLHPDVGGDAAVFAEFNQAFQELKTALKERVPW